MEDTCDREKNQQEFRQLLSTYNITQAKAAELISHETVKKVSVRAVRAWLAHANASTATPCPIWALVALNRAIKKMPSDKKRG
ncbi:hypothetical protein A1353_19050 [Methylomonas methanica]|uniref:Transcriptional regulator n=1 Tax=Methylomonas methanica TaxID=421 RepID=A0A177M592_METMH|nr:hypothetical protein [Methylomonas methanica]OAI00908.1 hypothetical protein A1353_19050 [Methylomonas methanica]